MKTKNKWMVSGAIALMLSQLAFAGSEGSGREGHGGDPSEQRVDEIRTDILSWIGAGGADALTLPKGIDLDGYKTKMSVILAPHVVIVSFTDQPVNVENAEKTCKNYISEDDHQPHVLCNIARFKGTSEMEQYRLIHHEFAGLAGLETGIGASSDYVISDEITEYLVETKVLRLAVKKTGGPLAPTYGKCYPKYVARAYNDLKGILDQGRDDYGKLVWPLIIFDSLLGAPIYLPIEATAGIDQLFKIKWHRMIRLIEESNEFLAYPDMRISTLKTLKSFTDKVNKSASDPTKKITPQALASAIVAGDRSGALCTNGPNDYLLSPKELLREIGDQEFPIKP